MRRGIARTAALLAAAAVLAGCNPTTAGRGRPGGGTGPSGPDFPSPTATRTTSATRSPVPTTAAPTSPSPTITPTRPSAAQLDAELGRQAPGQQRVIVPIGSGFQAATYDQRGGITFWSDDGTQPSWQRIGASSYPYSPAIGAPDAKAVGALLTGMHDATYIVTGLFSGDGSGNAVAFTNGARGWGVIKAEPNGNIGPSGEPVGPDRIGLAFGFAFVGGELPTADCPTNQPIATCGANPIVKLWRWTGQDFVRVA